MTVQLQVQQIMTSMVLGILQVIPIGKNKSLGVPPNIPIYKHRSQVEIPILNIWSEEAITKKPLFSPEISQTGKDLFTLHLLANRLIKSLMLSFTATI